MDTKDAIIKLYGDSIDTNKRMRELARLCYRSAKTQNNFNRVLCVNTFATTVSVLLAWLYILEQTDKIEKLSNEIEELKSEKGE